MTRNELNTILAALRGLTFEYRREHGIAGAYDHVLVQGENAVLMLEQELGTPGLRCPGSAFNGGRSTRRDEGC